MPLAVTLVDNTKAFSSIEGEEIMAGLKDQGVNPIYINILRHIDNQHSLSHLQPHDLIFSLLQGLNIFRRVRQGDTTSPKLFTSCLEQAFQQLEY